MNNQPRPGAVPALGPLLIPPPGAGGLAIACLRTIGEMPVKTPAFVVGFAAEARIARGLGWPVAIGGGLPAGARTAALRMVAAGASGLVSFGLAAGLDASLAAGTVLVADAVASSDQTWRTDPLLNAQLGGLTGHVCLGIDHIVADPAEKRRLGRETGAAIADMESAAVAAVASEAGLPFSVLRAVCDPASRNLPPAALTALTISGRIAMPRVIWSILTRPAQLPDLLGLARDAVLARRMLRRRIAALRNVQEAR